MPLTIEAGEVNWYVNGHVTGIPKATGDLKIGLTALEAGKDGTWNVLDFKNEDEEDVTNRASGDHAEACSGLKISRSRNLI